ncbi:MAG: hypothetical protein WCE61_17840 [Candidatus Acidiferrum sp.]
MGLLRRFFGSGKRKEKPYLDGGMHLLAKLVEVLQLDDWPKLIPQYTEAEQQAIVKQLQDFQQIANEVVGGQATFHPEIIESLRRVQVAQGLQNLAAAGWIFGGESDVPEDWKALISTYLKAWASGLDPLCLMEMADLLARAGYQAEARNAFKVVLLFPTYAQEFYGGHDASDTVNRIMSDARARLQRM